MIDLHDLQLGFGYLGLGLRHFRYPVTDSALIAHQSRCKALMRGR